MNSLVLACSLLNCLHGMCTVYWPSTGVGHFLVKISEEQIDVKLLNEFDQVYGNTPQKV